jgi:hypothetical protein
MQIQIYVMEVGERSRPLVRKCQNRPEKQSHFPPSFQSGQPPSRVLVSAPPPPPPRLVKLRGTGASERGVLGVSCTNPE